MASIRPFSLVLVLLAVMPTISLADNDGRDPMAILKSATDLIKSADEFSTEFEFAVKVGLPGLEHGRYARYDIAVERPNQFAFLRTDGDLGATVVSNGKQLTEYVPELRQYTQSNAPKTLDEFSTSVAGMMLIEQGLGGFMMALLSDDPVERLTSNATSSEYVAEEVIDGVACHQLEFIQPEWDINIWVTAGDQPSIRRIRPDVSKQFGAEEKEAGFSIVISLEYTKWNFDPQLTDASFAYTPPGSAELVEQLAARMPEAPVPPVVAVNPLVGQPAPKFSLVELGGDKAIELENVLGKKVVVLDFWATWCPPCVEGLPQLAEVAKAFKDKNVAVYAVNIQEDPETIQSFLTDRKLDLQVLLDAQGAAAQKYEVSGIPQTVLIGLDGRVQVVHTGLPADLKAELTESIDALLNGEDLAAKQLEESQNAGQSPDDPASR